MSRVPLIGVAVAAVAVSACGERPGAADAGRYTADLQPLNDSGVGGRADVAREGEHLMVRIQADGLAPNWVHGQAIHGFTAERQEVECPAEEFGDARLGAEEGESEYGRRLRKLEPYPSADSKGRIDYRLTHSIDPDQLEPLDTRTVVLRGASVGGDKDKYRPNRPVACGRLRLVARAER